jgi:hypothetical protein
MRIFITPTPVSSAVKPCAAWASGSVREVQAVAQMGVSCLAGRTVTTPVQRHDGDWVAGLPAVNAVAEFGDSSGHFVADDAWRIDARVHIAVIDVQVGAADSGVRNVDPHESGAGRFGGDGLQPQSSGAGVGDAGICARVPSGGAVGTRLAVIHIAPGRSPSNGVA